MWKLSRNTSVLALISKWTAKYKTLSKPLPVTPDWKPKPLPALLLPGNEENPADTGNVLPEPSQSQTRCLVLILAILGVLFSFSRRQHLNWLRLQQHLNNQGVFSSPQQSNVTSICESRNYPATATCSCWIGNAQMNSRSCCHKISTLSYFTLSICFLWLHFKRPLWKQTWSTCLTLFCSLAPTYKKVYIMNTYIHKLKRKKIYLFSNINIQLDLSKNKSIGIAKIFSVLISSVQKNPMPQANRIFPFWPPVQNE